MRTKIEVLFICLGAVISVAGIAAVIAVQNVHDYMVDHLDRHMKG